MTIAAGGGTDAAASSLNRAKRKPKKPGKARQPEQSLLLVVTPDGKFAPADNYSRKAARDRRMSVGKKFVSYMYEPRDETQWARAHVLAGYLVQYVEAYHGLTNHEALKKLQLLSGCGCEMQEQTIDLGALGIHKISVKVPESFAFGWMDETRFTEIYRGLSEYVGREYLGMIDAYAVEEIEKLLLREGVAA